MLRYSRIVRRLNRKYNTGSIREQIKEMRDQISNIETSLNKLSLDKPSLDEPIDKPKLITIQHNDIKRWYNNEYYVVILVGLVIMYFIIKYAKKFLRHMMRLRYEYYDFQHNPSRWVETKDLNDNDYFRYKTKVKC